MKSRIALSLLALFPLTACAAQTTAEDQAHARDCAVMQVLVAKVGAGRGALGITPDSFGLDCDWIKNLDSSPVIPVAAPGWHYHYWRPQYSPDGLQATEEYYWFTRERYELMDGFRCTLKKDGAHWHFVGCRLVAAT